MLRIMETFVWLFLTLFSPGICQVDVEGFQAYMGRIMDDNAWNRLDHALQKQNKYCHHTGVHTNYIEIDPKHYVKQYAEEYDFIKGV